MRYWWVNQNQTFRHEIEGGYLWSPKRNANGARNPFYESMREVAPGDLIFSFMDTRILAIGIAQSYCWESPKPLEFWNRRRELGKRWLEGESQFHEADQQGAPQGSHRITQAPSPSEVFTPSAKWKWPPIGLLDRGPGTAC
jgi:hypothetical protein